MSDNRKTNMAEVELRWYFGTGPSSAAGDLGLRGIDYEGLAQSVGTSTGVDVGAAEERMVRATHAAKRWRRIHAQLSAMPAKVDGIENPREVLWLAFGQEMIRAGISAVARRSKVAVRTVRRASDVAGREPTWVDLDVWLAKASQAELKDVRSEVEQMTWRALRCYAELDPRGERERERERTEHEREVA